MLPGSGTELKGKYPATDRNKVYLTGFMGSGKSTVGPILAGMLGCPFCDLDERIEQRAGMPIPEIFRKFGEPWFRELEKKELAKVAGEQRMVVALGGGAIIDPSNLRVVKNSGTLVYLKLPVEELYRRLKGCRERPLLCPPRSDGRQVEGRDLYRKIEDLLKKREPVYLQADYVVEAATVSPDECAELISSFLGGRR